eukprot:GDKK01002748.1.p1 GENE.GDKK01002748.1~~GDKK01002748.1.p1  ORF type:complete len:438 (+),score=99.98 GDKK01002748.1:170-1315(+)
MFAKIKKDLLKDNSPMMIDVHKTSPYYALLSKNPASLNLKIATDIQSLIAQSIADSNVINNQLSPNGKNSVTQTEMNQQDTSARKVMISPRQTAVHPSDEISPQNQRAPPAVFNKSARNINFKEDGENLNISALKSSPSLQIIGTSPESNIGGQDSLQPMMTPNRLSPRRKSPSSRRSKAPVSPLQQVCSLTARVARMAEREKRIFAVSTEFDILRKQLQADLHARKVYLAEELNGDAFNARSLGDLEKMHAFQRVRLARDQRFKTLDRRAESMVNLQPRGGGVYSKNKQNHKWLLDFDEEFVKSAKDSQIQKIISQTDILDKKLEKTKSQLLRNLSPEKRFIKVTKTLPPLEQTDMRYPSSHASTSPHFVEVSSNTRKYS